MWRLPPLHGQLLFHAYFSLLATLHSKTIEALARKTSGNPSGSYKIGGLGWVGLRFCSTYMPNMGQQVQTPRWISPVTLRAQKLRGRMKCIADPRVMSSTVLLSPTGLGRFLRSGSTPRSMVCSRQNVSTPTSARSTGP